MQKKITECSGKVNFLNVAENCYSEDKQYTNQNKETPIKINLSCHTNLKVCFTVAFYIIYVKLHNNYLLRLYYKLVGNQTLI